MESSEAPFMRCLSTLFLRSEGRDRAEVETTTYKLYAICMIRDVKATQPHSELGLQYNIVRSERQRSCSSQSVCNMCDTRYVYAT